MPHHFVLHAPRQTGKTSALIALRDLLNSGEVGHFRCVDVNVEVGQVARDDTDHEWFLRLRPLFSLVSIFF